MPLDLGGRGALIRDGAIPAVAGSRSLTLPGGVSFQLPVTYWRDRSPQLATAELLDCSERNGFAWREFTATLQAAGRTAAQHHLSRHLVRDGYWVDLHLSMMPYLPKDQQVFLDFLDSIRIEQKKR